MRHARQPPSDRIQSVSRALAILEVVGASQRGLNAKQIARRCGLHLATTYHLVRTLDYEGYLVREAGRYRLGLEVADRYRELSAALAAPGEVDGILRRHAERSGHSQYLAQIVDGEIAITAVAEGPRSPHVEDLIVGFDEGAHATALGKALLATMSRVDRHRYLRAQGMRPYTTRTIRDADELERELSATDDVFTERGQFRVGIGCIAAVASTTDGPVAIATCGTIDHLLADGQGLAVEVVAAAREVGDALTVAPSRPGVAAAETD